MIDGGLAGIMAAKGIAAKNPQLRVYFLCPNEKFEMAPALFDLIFSRDSKRLISQSLPKYRYAQFL